MWRMLRFVALITGSVIGAGPAFAQIMYSTPSARLPAPALPPIAIPPRVISPVPTFPTLSPIPAEPSLPAMVAPLPLPLRGDPTFGSLYQTIADLYRQGRYRDALPLAEDYVDKIDRAAGHDGVPYANAISLLSRLHQAQGDFDKAEQLLRRSLAIREDRIGPDSGDVGDRT
jgi:hypothetical protein